MVAAVPGERTAMAWQRTGWTALGAGALVLHAAPGVPGAVAGTILLLGGVSCAAVVAPSRMRVLAAAATTGRAVAPGVVATVAVVIVLVGILAVATMLVLPAR